MQEIVHHNENVNQLKMKGKTNFKKKKKKKKCTSLVATIYVRIIAAYSIKYKK